MKRWMIAGFLPAFAMLGALQACGDDDNGAGSPKADAGQDRSVPDTGPPSDSGNDSATNDGGTDGSSLSPTTLLKLDAGAGELPEGVVVVNSVPLVGLAPLGKVIKILPDGTKSDYASFGNSTDFFTLGLASDTAGNVYVGTAATGASPSTAPGIYKIPAGGGTPTSFATPVVGSPFAFVNGLDFVGTDLFATDSSGKIFKVTSAGATTKWLEDAQLAGDEQDCKLGNGFPIGVNGIVHDANNFYVVNTDKGTLLKIANNGGAAGAITLIKKDPQLCGADGLALDKDGTFIIAVNAKDSIVRVTPQGAITTLFQGKPLDSPATVYIDTSGTARRLIVTNAAFRYSATDGGTAGSSVVSFPLP